MDSPFQYDKPLHDYYIKSANYTRLFSEYESYPTNSTVFFMLEDGFRGLSFDVYLSDANKLHVAHHKYNCGDDLLFSEVLASLSDWLAQNKVFLPLVLVINTLPHKLPSGQFADNLAPAIANALLQAIPQEQLITRDLIGLHKEHSSGVYNWPFVKDLIGKVLLLIAAPDFANIPQEQQRYFFSLDMGPAVAYEYNTIRKPGFFAKLFGDPHEKNKEALKVDLLKNRLIYVHPLQKASLFKRKTIDLKYAMNLHCNIIPSESLKIIEKYFAEKSYIEKS